MKLQELGPTKRFANRESDYSRARPEYPKEIIYFLENQISFSVKSIVADVGSGTGKLTLLFLKNGNEVFAVEPNISMRSEAERLLGRFRNFHSIEGRAEMTGLRHASVNLVSVGQAFHWFDPRRTRVEFARILKPGGHVLLVWNTRKKEKGTFSYDYEILIEKGRSERIGWTSGEAFRAAISKFFGRRSFEAAKFQNTQKLNFELLLARLRSASYLPKEGPHYENLARGAKKAFAKHASGGSVTLEYETEVFLGKIG